MDEISRDASPRRDRKFPAASRGFTLVELLVVVAIIGLLMTMSMGSFQNVVMGTGVSRGGQMVGDLITLARQEAVSKNRETLVCFYRFSSGATPGWRALQVWRMDPDPASPASTTASAVTPLQMLPDGIVIAASTSSLTDDPLSPLLGADLTSTSVTNVISPGLGTSNDAVGFRFKPDGATYVFLDSKHNFLTVQNVHDQGNFKNTGSTPVNYYTVQVDPVAGQITVYRP